MNSLKEKRVFPEHLCEFLMNVHLHVVLNLNPLMCLYSLSLFSRSITESSFPAAAARGQLWHDPPTSLQSNAGQSCRTSWPWTLPLWGVPACSPSQLLPAWATTHFLPSTTRPATVDQASNGRSSISYPSSVSQPQPGSQDAPCTGHTPSSCRVLWKLLPKPTAATARGSNMAVQHSSPTNGATQFHEHPSPRPCGKSCEPSFQLCSATAAVIGSLQLCTTRPAVPQCHPTSRPQDAPHLSAWIYPAR